MQVKPGYKQTEVGVLPEDWEVAPVRQKGEVVTGKALAATAPGKQRPYLRTKNVFDGRIDVDDVLTMPMTDEQFEHFRARRGDVLLNEGQSLELVGRCAMYQDEYPEPCAIQNQLIRFRARTEVSGVFASYLFRRCQHTGVFAKIALQTTSIAHLGGSRFGNLLLGWPKTEAEQHAIAEALSDVDALLGALERLIAKKRDLKQAAMQQLLTGQTRLPGFGGKWEVIPMSSLMATPIQNGVFNEPSRKGRGCKLVNVIDLYGRFPIATKNLERFDANKDELSRFGVKHGDLFFTRSSLTPDGIAQCNLYGGCDDEAIVYDCHIIRVRPDQTKTDPFYLARFCLSQPARTHLVTNAKTTTMTTIDQAVIANLPVVLPALPEQTAIAEVLSDMDAELAALQQRREKTRVLKQGMMQELLTGRTRLV